jgi:hypothetical protein
VGFVAAGLVIGTVGAFNVFARRSVSLARPVVAAVSMAVLGLITGVLYSVGVPVVNPSHAPTRGRARPARIVRWPLGLTWVASAVVLLIMDR